MNITSLYHIFNIAKGATTDSRNCPEGSMFFALKGERFNGNLYAKMALDKGCHYAVVDDITVVKDERYILVDDVLSALQDLANHHRRILATPIIGITGSNGKTTTKELLAAVLSKRFNLHFTQGNFNNHIGVPLTLLQLKKSHEMAIIEMGANHLGEIAQLCAIAEPDMGIITNIGKAHLEGFGGIDGVIKTKKELYDFIRITDGRVFVNGADELLMSLSNDIKRTCYNEGNSLFRVEVLEAMPTLTLVITHKGGQTKIKSQLVGEYNCINVATVLEVGHYWDIPLEQMKEALEAYAPSNNRSQIIKTKCNKVILDAYNANPASMAVAIDNFTKLDMPNKVVLLGAMKELGEYSAEEHQALVKAISSDEFRLKLLVGKEFENLSDQPEDILFFKSPEDVRTYLKNTPIKESTVLLKGSRSMKMESLVDFL